MANNKKKVLIIEDEKLQAKAIAAKLTKQGFDVYEAYNGKDGLDIALDKHPDLILLDIVLPEMDGITLLDSVRKDDWGKNVPVIILTNLSRAETVKKSREKGVNTFLVKTDWKLDEVVAKVKYELEVV